VRAFANFVRCDLLFIRMCLDDAFLLGGNRGPSTNILGATGTTKDHFGGIMYVCMYVSFKTSQKHKNFQLFLVMVYSCVLA
jgi:hypothetical protein